jgi:hypothetical protein
LRKGFHKYFLGHLFNNAALPEEFTGKPKDPRAVAAHDLSKRRLVTIACELRQLQIRPLIVIYTQKRSSNNTNIVLSI